jgi:hypothetical protein
LQDQIPQPRGFAMKLFNVDGEMFEASRGVPTQDIEFSNSPVIELADAKVANEILDIRLNNGHDKTELYKQLQQRSDIEI